MTRPTDHARAGDTALGEQLAAGADRLGVALSRSAIAQLLDYLTLMERWNRVVNLTAVREPAAMVTRHLLDSLAVLPYIPPGTLIDVGSGAGLPGIPVAVAQPDRAVTLLDRAQKRIRFLTEVAAQLALTNVALVAERVEDYHPPRRFAVVITRAFASLGDIVSATASLLAEGGVIIALKGARPTEELAQLPPTFVAAAVHEVDVPGLHARRHVVILTARP